jgi:hypothetical protein
MSVTLLSGCAHFQARKQKEETTDFTDDTDKNFGICAIREIRGLSLFCLSA